MKAFCCNNLSTIILIGYFVSLNLDTSISRILLIPIFAIGIFNLVKNSHNCRGESGKIFLIQCTYVFGFLALPFIDPFFSLRDLDHASRFVFYVPIFTYFLCSRFVKFDKVVLSSSLIFSLIYLIIICLKISLKTKIDTAQILLVLGLFNYYYYIKRKKIIFLITMLLNCFIIVNLEVRSVILYGFILPFFVEFFIFRKTDLCLVKFKRVFIICGTIIISILFSESSRLRLVNGFNSTAIHFSSGETYRESKNSVNYRIEYIENGVIDFFTSPFFGIGRTGAVESINHSIQFYGQERFSHHHNELISTLCMRGLFGLIFLILYFYLIFNLIKHNPDLINKRNSSQLLIMLISQITFFILDSPFIGSMKSVDFFLITFFMLYAQFVKRND